MAGTLASAARLAASVLLPEPLLPITRVRWVKGGSISSGSRPDQKVERFGDAQKTQPTMDLAEAFASRASRFGSRFPEEGVPARGWNSMKSSIRRARHLSRACWQISGV